MFRLIMIIIAVVFVIRIIPSIKTIISSVSKNAQESRAIKKRYADVQERHQAVLEQMDKDLKILSHSFKCPSCGGTLTITTDHISSYCQFCGAALPKAEELTKLAYEYNDKKAQRDLEIERMKHEERQLRESNADKRSTNRLLFLIILLVFVPIVFGMVWMVLK